MTVSVSVATEMIRHCGMTVSVSVATKLMGHCGMTGCGNNNNLSSAKP